MRGTVRACHTPQRSVASLERLEESFQGPELLLLPMQDTSQSWPCLCWEQRKHSPSDAASQVSIHTGIASPEGWVRLGKIPPKAQSKGLFYFLMPRAAPQPKEPLAISTDHIRRQPLLCHTRSFSAALGRFVSCEPNTGGTHTHPFFKEKGIYLPVDEGVKWGA